MNNKNIQQPFFTKSIIIDAVRDSFIKLNPLYLIKNPVMFIVAAGALLTTIIFLLDLSTNIYSSFNLQVSIWLWFTVLFANFAEAIAEGRGKAQSENLRKSRTTTNARKLVENKELHVAAIDLRSGDIVICSAGDIIPADGEVIEGIASVDESAITGESAPVIRESGGDRSAVTGGTRVLSDKIVIRVSADPGETYIDKMIALVEGAKRKKTPNEIALTILLSGLTIIFLIVVVSFKYYLNFYRDTMGQDVSVVSTTILIALLVCLIPTTIGGLLSAIGHKWNGQIIKT